LLVAKEQLLNTNFVNLEKDFQKALSVLRLFHSENLNLNKNNSKKLIK
jgi:hypothetical protein